MSAEYHLPLLAKADPRCSAVSVIAELLVNYSEHVNLTCNGGQGEHVELCCLLYGFAAEC